MLEPGLLSLVQRFVSFLQSQKEPVKSHVIEKELGIDDEAVRNLMSYCARSGYFVCSTKKGYWWARSEQDLLDHLSFIRGKYKALGERILGQEKALARWRCGQREQGVLL